MEEIVNNALTTWGEYVPNELYDITQDRQIRTLERDALQALTGSMSFEDWGNYLCRRIEVMAPGVLVSVCRIAERRMCPWAAPSFPAEYGEFFEGMEVGEGVASCGTAAHRGKPVTVRDIATDPLWTPYKHVMLPHGFRACWTYPVKRRDNSIAATFAFYFKEGGGPNAWLERIAEAGIHLSVLAIEREENRQEIDRLAQFDSLTGLPNRNHLFHHIDALLQAPPPEKTSFVLIGVDRFNDINEAFGQSVGDRILVLMAGRIQEKLMPGQFLSRFDGDEFVVVVQDSDAAAISRMVKRLLEAVSGRIEINGRRLHLAGSVGVSFYPESGKDRDTLLATAKSAMLQVKQAGGGSYQFFSETMHLVAQDRLLLGEALKKAIKSDGLSLHYQPQINSATGKLHGVEALARWWDPEFGHIPPGKFINLAEETGQIEAIGRWALREACSQMAEWRAAGIAVPTISVNLSPVNFYHVDLPDYIAGLLHEFGMGGESLVIEMTESTMVALTEDMLTVVDGIRALGAGLSVDDFGTGFSSLSNLVNLPVTEVKIDKSFVDKCLEEERLVSLIAAVISMGRSLNLTVVAEGVETVEQQALLAKYHCPVLQGYLFAKPLKASELSEWIATSAKGVERTEAVPA